jgi:signal transduction histidine kinase
VVLVVILSVLGGVAAHAALRAAAQSEVSTPLLFILGCTFLALLGPATWAATFLVLRPLRRLADVASQIQRGDLDRRAQLPESADEVGEVGAALRGVADRVARQVADQKALLATVSHELRSPLARARVLVELAREGREVADDLDAEITAMDALVGDLLAAARVDFEAVHPIEMPVSELIQRAVHLAGQGALPVPATEALVRVDPTLGARALSLILDNAAKHGGGVDHLEVVVHGAQVGVFVLDRGPGFAGDAAKVFQPLWRGATPQAGAGLGLALVRHIAEAHGGRTEAADRPDGGARVGVWWPAAVP